MKSFPLGKAKFLKRAELSRGAGGDGHESGALGTSRNKMAVLKSDVILLQTEIDAITGEAGILDTQGRLERCTWSPDVETCNRNLESLYILVLQKVNELVRVCGAAKNAAAGNMSVPHAYPADSKVGDVIHFFHRTVHTLSSSVGGSPSSHPGGGGNPLYAAIEGVPVSSQASVIGLLPTTSFAAAQLAGDASNINFSSSPNNRSVANSTTASQLVDDPDGVSWTATAGSRKSMNLRQGSTRAYGGDGPVLPGGGGVVVAESLAEIQPQLDVFDIPRDHPAASPPSMMTKAMSATLPPTSGRDGFGRVPSDLQSLKKSATSGIHNVASEVAGTASSDDDGIDDDNESGGSLQNNSNSAVIAALRREVHVLKSKLHFFRSLDKHLARVPDAIDATLNLSVKNVSFEGLAVHAKSLLSEFPFGGGATQAAPNLTAVSQSLQQSPGAKSAASLQRRGTGIGPADGKSGGLDSAAPPTNEEKQKYLYAIAFQNAFIDLILSQHSDKLRIAASQELADAKQRIDGLEKVLRSQAEQSSKEKASLTVKCDRLSNIINSTVTVDSSASTGHGMWATNCGSRPLSRTSLMDSPIFAAQHHPDHQRPPLLLPPRPNSSMSLVELPSAGGHRPPLTYQPGLSSTTSDGGSRPTSRVSNRPLIATKLEDLEGEKERRLLQLIKSQGDIIKDMTARQMMPGSSTSSANALKGASTPMKLSSSLNFGSVGAQQQATQE